MSRGKLIINNTNCCIRHHCSPKNNKCFAWTPKSVILGFRELGALHISERRVGSGWGLLADQIPRALWENEFGKWQVKFNVVAIIMNLLHSVHENRPKRSRAGSAHVVPALWPIVVRQGICDRFKLKSQMSVQLQKKKKSLETSGKQWKTCRSLQFSFNRFISFKVTVWKTPRSGKRF